MKRALVLVAGALVLGCGSHAELSFTGVTAQRLADGRVELTATVVCGIVGVPDCGDLTHHCVKAEWFAAEGLKTQSGSQVTTLPAKGETVDMNGEYASLPTTAEATAETCNDRLLKEGEADTLRITSVEPIPADRELVIRVTTTSHGGMAEDLERIVVSP